MGRTRGCLWLVAGVLVALLAAAVAYLVLNRASQVQTGAPATAPEVEVVVAARAIPVRSVLTAEDVQLKKMPVSAAPQGALRETGEAEGKVTLVDLYPGEVLLAQRLVDPNEVSANGRMALVVAADEVLMAFPAGDRLTQTGVLKPGDHVDLLFSLQFPTEREGGGGGSGGDLQTFNVLQNVTIASVVGQSFDETGAQQGAAQALLFTVSPQDALVLKWLIDSSAVTDIVLRAQGAEGPFTVEPVDMDYVIDRYQIPTQVGR
jgi:pilus assembly protein CpaB